MPFVIKDLDHSIWVLAHKHIIHHEPDQFELERSGMSKCAVSHSVCIHFKEFSRQSNGPTLVEVLAHFWSACCVTKIAPETPFRYPRNRQNLRRVETLLDAHSFKPLTSTSESTFRVCEQKFAFCYNFMIPTRRGTEIVHVPCVILTHRRSFVTLNKGLS